ncbi:MAG: FtsH protease activity modulator HflK [Chloroflexi bacterium]|nr:FtsH protease activity modulator HflK [Chloroflexota bacterium]
MYRQEESEVNFDQILERIRGFAKRLRLGGGGGGAIGFIVIGLLAVAAVVWLGTGVYSVQPGEQAALRMLGKFSNTTEAGLHWFWPAPIGTRAVVAVDTVQSLEVGVRGSTPVLAESLMITGDENIVDVQLQVQFDIRDIEAFLFRAVDPSGVTIKDAAETALRQVVGSRSIDDVLTTEKEAVQIETKERLQDLMDTYETGIRIREVKLLNVRPPVQVQDAFDDVVRAKENKQQVIREAEAYLADIVPRARGDAARLTEEAQAFKAQRVNIATGDAERFRAILVEFKNSPEVTRQRLYLEAMEVILPNITKFIVDSDAGGNLLQFLPLTQTSGTGTVQTPVTAP